MTNANIKADRGLIVPAGRYRLDPDRSVIRADVKALFGLLTVRGTFRLGSGEIQVAQDPGRSSVRVVIDAGSFDSGNTARDRDVLSPALLDVTAHPEISFAAESAHRDTRGWVLHGSVTVHGVSKPVDVQVTDTAYANGVAKFHATAHLDRTRFGITKKKGTVGRTAQLRIEAVALPVTETSPPSQ